MINHERAYRRQSVIKHSLILVFAWVNSILLLAAVALPFFNCAIALPLMIVSLKMEPEKLLALAASVLYAALSSCALVGLALCLAGFVRYRVAVMWFTVSLSVLYVLPFLVGAYMGFGEEGELYLSGFFAFLGFIVLVETPIVFYFIDSNVLLT